MKKCIVLVGALGSKLHDVAQELEDRGYDRIYRCTTDQQLPNEDIVVTPSTFDEFERANRFAHVDVGPKHKYAISNNLLFDSQKGKVIVLHPVHAQALQFLRKKENGYTTFVVSLDYPKDFLVREALSYDLSVSEVTDRVSNDNKDIQELLFDETPLYIRHPSDPRYIADTIEKYVDKQLMKG